MPTTFEKLNLKHQAEIVILHAPDSFEPEIATLQSVQIHRDLKSAPALEFALAFVTGQSEVDTLIPPLLAKAKGDAILWFAYPKGTSKRLKCDFNRDTGWEQLKAAQWDTVRAVAIDEDWSALRFRKIEYIKNSIRR